MVPVCITCAWLFNLVSLQYALTEDDNDVKGIISVHGGLMPLENNTNPTSPRVLVLSGKRLSYNL